jgi:hypothetical protein
MGERSPSRPLLREGNRRKSARFAVGSGIEAVVDGFGDVKLIDLSARGARIAAARPLQRGTRLRLKINDQSSAISVHIDGTVVWSSEESEGNASGVEFEHEATTLKTAIADLCRAGRARKI